MMSNSTKLSIGALAENFNDIKVAEDENEIENYEFLERECIDVSSKNSELSIEILDNSSALDSKTWSMIEDLDTDNLKIEEISAQSSKPECQEVSTQKIDHFVSETFETTKVNLNNRANFNCESLGLYKVLFQEEAISLFFFR